MPLVLVLLGVVILIIALLVVPFFSLLLSNPVLIGGGLVVFGLAWIAIPKLLYGLGYMLIHIFYKIYYLWIDRALPNLRERAWWQALIKVGGKLKRIACNSALQRTALYTLIVVMVAILLYFHKNPLIN